MDFCCPSPESVLEVGEVSDSLERVDCGMEPGEFRDRFVLQGEPVVLVGCTSRWVVLYRTVLYSTIMCRTVL